jgi:hypothetical protein
VGYDGGVEVMRTALKQYAIEHFGGLGITGRRGRNLSLDPVYAGAAA